MEGARRVTGGSGRGQRAERERAADVDDGRRRRQPSRERGGQLGHDRIGHRQEGDLGRRDDLRWLAPGDQLGTVAGGAEGPRQRAPEASAADYQEVDSGFG
jgi:hypothetical protein